MAEISIDFWSFMLLAGSLQGLLLSLILLSNKTHNSPNVILSFIIWFLIWVQLEFFFVRSMTEQLEFTIFYGTRYGSWLLIGPLVLLYSKSIISKEFKADIYNLLHFIPFLLFAIAIPLLFSDAIPERGKFYGMLTVIRNKNMGLTPIQRLYGVLFFLQFIHAGVYALGGVNYLRRQKKTKRLGTQQINLARVKWIEYCCLIFGFIMLSSLLYFYLLFFSTVYKRWMDYLYILPSTGLIYVLAVNAYRKPYLFRDDLKYIVSKKKYAKTPIDNKQSEKYIIQITKYLETNKPYLNPNIRLGDLAKEISIPKHHLSRILNEHFHCNFNEFINKYRIEEAKKVMASKNNKSNFLNIAYAVGFNNKASFNNYFKKFTSMTPKEYQKKINSKN